MGPVAAVLVLTLLSESPPDVAASASRAKALYAEGRFAEAAEIFERLWEEHGASKYLFNAAAAHEAAGREVVALVHYLHYLQLDGVDPGEWKEVRVRIGKLQARLVPVSVKVTPPALTGRVTLIARRTDGASTVRAELGWLVGSSDAPETIHLTPGTWALRLEVQEAAKEHYTSSGEVMVYVPLPGEEAAGATATLTAKPVDSALTLRLGPPEALRRGVEVRLYDQLQIEPTIVTTTRDAETKVGLRTGPWRYVVTPRGRGGEIKGEVEVSDGAATVVERHDLISHRTRGARADSAIRPQRLALAGVVSGGVLLVASGGVMLGLGERRRRDARQELMTLDGTPFTAYDPRVEGANALISGGAGLLGGGLGLGVTAVGVGLRAPRSLWWGELGAGGATAIAGVVWYGSAFTRTTDRKVEIPEGGDGYVTAGSIDHQHGELIASSAVLGLGVAVTVGAATALAFTRRGRSRSTARANPFVGRGVSGLMVTGAF